MPEFSYRIFSVLYYPARPWATASLRAALASDDYHAVTRELISKVEQDVLLYEFAAAAKLESAG
jgi:hypothetical protein